MSFDGTDSAKVAAHPEEGTLALEGPTALEGVNTIVSTSDPEAALASWSGIVAGSRRRTQWDHRRPVWSGGVWSTGEVNLLPH